MARTIGLLLLAVMVGALSAMVVPASDSASAADAPVLAELAEVAPAALAPEDRPQPAVVDTPDVRSDSIDDLDDCAFVGDIERIGCDPSDVAAAVVDECRQVVL